MPSIETGGLTRVAITGLGVTSAFGRGAAALQAGLRTGIPAFAPVTRFDVAGRRVRAGALLTGAADLGTELAGVLAEARDQARLCEAEFARATHLLALHGPAVDLPGRVYTSACVAASTAVADAASMIAHGDAERVVVAAGYLVEPYQFALFDAGRALASDSAVRPFSSGRRGLLLGDGVAAIVLEAEPAARSRRADPLGWITGWGRSGDAYHVCQPHPEGAGLSRAVAAALRRARLSPDDLGYVNAHGSGSVQSDAAEAQALHDALGPAAGKVPLSSTKALHGQSLEASPLVELIGTVLSLRAGTLPVNAGWLGPDEDCPVAPILHEPAVATGRHALSVNMAFGGANTALVVEAAR